MRVTGNVRTHTDLGAVVCLDPRIITKPYGRLFIESLPECRRVEATTSNSSPPQRPKLPARAKKNHGWHG